MSLAKHPWIVLVGGLLTAWVATPALAAPQTCFGHQATIIGTKGDDRIVGTATRDVIVGRAGADTVRSLDGNDLVCGGGGEDRLILGPGADKGKGQGRDDLIKGLGGRDLILGGRGDDFEGGLYGGRNRDRLVGGRGDDYLEGGSGKDVNRAGTGFDLMIDGPHAFDDEYFGGRGFDNVRWIGRSPVVVDLRTGQATGHGGDTLASIEHIDGGEGSDTLIGNSASNDIDGFGGNDHIEGRAGDDFLNGGSGTDSDQRRSRWRHLSTWRDRSQLRVQLTEGAHGSHNSPSSRARRRGESARGAERRLFVQTSRPRHKRLEPPQRVRELPQRDLTRVGSHALGIKGQSYGNAPLLARGSS